MAEEGRGGRPGREDLRGLGKAPRRQPQAAGPAAGENSARKTRLRAPEPPRVCPARAVGRPEGDGRRDPRLTSHGRLARHVRGVALVSRLHVVFLRGVPGPRGLLRARASPDCGLPCGAEESGPGERSPSFSFRLVVKLYKRSDFKPRCFVSKRRKAVKQFL